MDFVVSKHHLIKLLFLVTISGLCCQNEVEFSQLRPKIKIFIKGTIGKF